MAFIQRFDSAINVNVHFHVLFLDGAYVVDGEEPSFRSAAVPTTAELVAASTAISNSFAAGSPVTMHSQPMRSASMINRASAGSWRTAGAVHEAPVNVRLGESSAEVAGFSLHSGVSVSARDRDGLERLVRYVAMPPLANEQLGSGATHAFLAPLQLFRRLVSLIPPSGQNLIRYFGVLGPAAKLRSSSR